MQTIGVERLKDKVSENEAGKEAGRWQKERVRCGKSDELAGHTLLLSVFLKRSTEVHAVTGPINIHRFFRMIY